MLILKKLPRTNKLDDFIPVWISNANKLLKKNDMSLEKFDSYLNHEEHKVSLYQLCKLVQRCSTNTPNFSNLENETKCPEKFLKTVYKNNEIKQELNKVKDDCALSKLQPNDYDLYKTLKKLHLMRESLKAIEKVKAPFMPYRKKVVSHILRTKWTLPKNMYEDKDKKTINTVYKVYMAYLYDTFKTEATALEKEIAIFKKTGKSSESLEKVIGSYDKLGLPATSNEEAKTLIQNFAKALNPPGTGSPWSDKGPWANLPAIGAKIQKFIEKVDRLKE